jgi:predicted ester cyclase
MPWVSDAVLSHRAQEGSVATESNKAIVRRYLEGVINRGNFGVAEEIIAPNYINHSAGGGIGSGRNGFVQGLRALLQAFPDWHVTIDELLADGEFVVDRFTSHATNTGSANGIPPTGRRIATMGMHMWRLAGGKLVEGWYVTDALPHVFAALTPAPSTS